MSILYSRTSAFLLILMASFFYNQANAKITSLKLDKLFYFYNNTESIGVVKVSNESSFLTAVSFKVYDQKNKNEPSGLLEFDFENDSEEIDVFPNEFILSPGRKQKVSLNIYPVGNGEDERIFRVRAIPVPLKEMLVDNVELKKLLSEEQRLMYIKEGNTTAAVNVGIGYGAIIIAQPFSEINPNSLIITGDDTGFYLNNRSKYVVEISKLTINGRFMNDLIIKGLSRKKLELEEGIIEFKGVLQNDIKFKCDNNGECNEI